MHSFSKLIDHTNLSPEASESDIINLCKEAIEYGFASVCINPFFVPLAVSLLADESPKVCTVIGFPIGAISAEMKFAEARFLVHQGAEELDMVMNIGALKEGKKDVLEHEVSKVVQAADQSCVKVIIETTLLNDNEKILASSLIKDCGASFVKTSTGFSSGGATVEDIKLLRKTVGSDMGVKASGGIKTLLNVNNLVDAGADRIGTSNGIAIVS